jgi:hypothetical protein
MSNYDWDVLLCHAWEELEEKRFRTPFRSQTMPR